MRRSELGRGAEREVLAPQHLVRAGRFGPRHVLLGDLHHTPERRRACDQGGLQRGRVGGPQLEPARWDRIQRLVEHSLKSDGVTHLALSDYVDNAETLRRTLGYCKQSGARFTTLTQLVAEL